MFKIEREREKSLGVLLIPLLVLDQSVSNDSADMSEHALFQLDSHKLFA